jgi:glycosyltransferase involved in cell wall biosynthesis
MIEGLPGDRPLNLKPRLLFMPRDNKGAGFYRMLLPASKLKDMGITETEVTYGWNDKLVDWADVIILQRPSETDFYGLIEETRGKGKKVIYEIDDLLYGVAPENAGAWEFWNPETGHLGRALKIMTMCNAITVTTERLAAEYALVNRNIHVLPNYLDKDQWEVPKNWTITDWNFYYRKKYDDIIRIGWAGSASHKVDLEMIAKVLVKIANKYPQVHFILMGFTPKDTFGMIPLRGTKCSHCGAEGQLEIEEGTDLLNYPNKLKSLAFDIGLAPIVENSFNECKSDIKLKEYGALGIPVVASGIKPYSPSLKHGVTGYLATNGKEWFDYLELLIQDRGKREEMGKSAYQFYQENTIDRHINEWLDVYRIVVNPHYPW